MDGIAIKFTFDMYLTLGLAIILFCRNIIFLRRSLGERSSHW